MNQEIQRQMNAQIRDFRLPGYQEITDVGLFLDQTARFVNGCFESFPEMKLTTSMISNYVKQKLVPHPVKKLYGRRQIAALLFIAVLKTVLPLTDIRRILELQYENTSEETAYNRFCAELGTALQEVFEEAQPHGTAAALPGAAGKNAKAPAPPAQAKEGTASEQSETEDMLRFAVLTAAHRIHLELFMRLTQEMATPMR